MDYLGPKILTQKGDQLVAFVNIDTSPPEESGVHGPCAGTKQRQCGADRSEQQIRPVVSAQHNGAPKSEERD